MPAGVDQNARLRRLRRFAASAHSAGSRRPGGSTRPAQRQRDWKARQIELTSVDDSDQAVYGRIARGAVHTLSSTYAGRLVGWIAIIVLTRKLPPEDFGHIALAVSLLALVNALRNCGLHLALLHQYDRVDQLAPTHLILNTALAALSTLVAIGLAVLLVGPKYGQTVAMALAVFAAFDLLRTVAMTAETQLRHDLQFSALARASAVALIVAATAGIVTVYLGGGIWALILSHSVHGIAYVAVFCALIWRRRPPLFRLSDFDPAGARRLIRYGLWFWFGAALQALLLNLDRLTIGALLEARMLGFYERAHVFAQLPTGAITLAIGGITATVFARYQHDVRQLSGACRRILRFMLRATVPVTVALAIEIPLLARLLLGEEWLPLVPILRCLLVFSLCRPILETVQSLLLSVGDARGIVGFAAVQLALLAVAAPLLTRSMGVEGTALAMGAMALCGVILALRRAARHVEVPLTRTFAPALLAAAAAAVVRLSAGDLLVQCTAPLALALGVALFSLCYAGALLALERGALLDELRTVRTILKDNREPPPPGSI